MSETTTEVEDLPAETIDPAESPSPAAAGDTAAPEVETPPSPTPEPPPPSQQPDWRDKRIATLTRRLRELQEKGQVPPEAQVAQPPAQQIDQALIDQRARELAAVADFNRRCDETALAGRAQFGEAAFNERIANLQKLSDPTDSASVTAYNQLLMAALDAGDADRLLYDLGADMNEAQRILALPPTKMAVELTKRSLRPVTQVSNAPKPITPIGSRTASHEPIEPDNPDRADHLSTAEWMRRREAQIEQRRKANGA